METETILSGVFSQKTSSSASAAIANSADTPWETAENTSSPSVYLGSPNTLRFRALSSFFSFLLFSAVFIPAAPFLFFISTQILNDVVFKTRLIVL